MPTKGTTYTLLALGAVAAGAGIGYYALKSSAANLTYNIYDPSSTLVAANLPTLMQAQEIANSYGIGYFVVDSNGNVVYTVTVAEGALTSITIAVVGTILNINYAPTNWTGYLNMFVNGSYAEVIPVYGIPINIDLSGSAIVPGYTIYMQQRPTGVQSNIVTY